MISSRPVVAREDGNEHASRLVGLVDGERVVGDEVGERVRDPVEQRVEALLREDLVEDVRELGDGLDEPSPLLAPHAAAPAPRPRHRWQPRPGLGPLSGDLMKTATSRAGAPSAAVDPARVLDGHPTVPKARGRDSLVQSYRQLADIFHDILSEHSLDNLLDRIADTLADLVPHDTLSIYQADEAQTELIPVLARDKWAEQDHEQPPRLRRGNHRLGRRQREPVRDEPGSPRPAREDGARALRPTSRRR